jgi:CRP-like cAMP-binding protein
MISLSEQLSTLFDLKTDQMDQLVSLFREETMEKGEFHTKEGGYHTQLSFVKEGYMRIYSHHNGKEVTQWISAPGDFTTELGALLFNRPARWNIVALEEVKLVSLNKDDYLKLSTTMPDWPLIERAFMSKCFMQLEDRVHSFLTLTAEERYQHLMTYRKDLFLKVPQQHLASMLGMTPETLSRVRKKLQ